MDALRRPHPSSEALPNKALSRQVITDFDTWIRMGAPDPRGGNEAKPERKALAPPGRHWAFQPVQDPSLAAVRNAGWIKDPIDRFTLARLEKSGGPPVPQEDRAALIRRASVDLTGQPPTAGETEAFAADRSPDAFAKVVDRLLSSKRFGERWGGHWLDLARYTNSTSAKGGGGQENAWRYRDYVINAFNADKPYDQFIREQLAGDLLPGGDEAAERERMIATGFLMVGIKLGAEPRRARLALEVADGQIEATTRAFLGLTVACARCHEHKSDPISMRDYYALAGIFTSTESLASGAEGLRRGSPRWLERSLATREELIAVSEYESRFEELKEQLREAREMKTAFPGEIDSASLEGIVVDNLAAEIHGAWKESSYSTNFVDRNYLHDGDADKGRKSARFVPDVPEEGLYEVLVSYTPRANRATNVPVTITSKDGTRKVFLNQTLAPTMDKVFAPVGRFTFAAGDSGSITISNEGAKGFVVVDAVRLRPVQPSGPGARAVAEERAPENALLSYRELEKELLEFRAKRPVSSQAWAVQDGNIRDCKLRLEGDPDKLGEEVPRGFPRILGMPNSTFYVITDESSGRLELANWIARPENPLTARVAANRIWMHLFGRGLVETPDDFGALGSAPSNPELLDYLAARFVKEGWSVKNFIRAIMLSSTYQLSVPPH